MPPALDIRAGSVRVERFDPRSGVLRSAKDYGAGQLTVEPGSEAISIQTGKATLSMPLSGKVKIHSRFLAEGRTTIVSPELGLRLMLSAAQPHSLARLLDAAVAGKRRKAASALPAPSALPSHPIGHSPPSLPPGRRGGEPEWRKHLASPSKAERAIAAARRARFALSPGSPSDGAGAGLGDRPAASTSSGGAASTRGAAADAAPHRASHRSSESFESLPLTSEQRQVLRAIGEGHSVFFTGAAGCGKSVLLRRIIASLPAASTAVTAPTGVAACNVGGTTLHAFSGAGTRPDASASDVAARVRRSPETLARWRRTRVLIVDEVSMLDGAALDMLEEVARRVRSDPRPFGGLQLVLAGDFLQLPPVSKGGAARKPYAFEAACWGKCVSVEVELTRVFRQADRDFVDVLNAIRWGVVTPAARAALDARWGADVVIAGADGGPAIRPTLLFTHRADVDAVNEKELARLRGDEVVLRGDDTAHSPGARRALESACPAPASLRLRVGAQVMLVRNLDVGAGLVNGARGVVLGFSGTLRYPQVRFASGTVTVLGKETFSVQPAAGARAFRKQVPLRLAFAMSVHKSQGTSLDAVSMSLGRVFEAGQAYVALSRARSLAGLSLLDKFKPECVRACPVALKFYTQLRRSHWQSRCLHAPLVPRLRRRVPAPAPAAAVSVVGFASPGGLAAP
ncbi:hypothetical protein FNF27_03912 [Cafeteria roenbergensis]|uniref:ATP-dependent DNA helicase n=1 Tax=Cafeteria roenbergensis TaxID=33653 RepID=A0A5A8EBC3_CAFRO|nr:hypothetical protein FNF27_03912 [Cafeteria roenbergensis]